jgi:hypothetical protein
MDKMKCSYEGCRDQLLEEEKKDNDALAYHLCQNHQKYVLEKNIQNEDLCEIKECRNWKSSQIRKLSTGEKQYISKYCQAHFKEMQSIYQKNSRNNEKKKRGVEKCNRHNCKNSYHYRGLCKEHFNEKRKKDEQLKKMEFIQEEKDKLNKKMRIENKEVEQLKKHIDEKDKEFEEYKIKNSEKIENLDLNNKTLLDQMKTNEQQLKEKEKLLKEKEKLLKEKDKEIKEICSENEKIIQELMEDMDKEHDTIKEKQKDLEKAKQDCNSIVQEAKREL